MNAVELRRRIARLKKEKKDEKARERLRTMERGAISEAREATRARRISGIRLGVEKAKIYKALPLPHIRPRDEGEEIRRAERRAQKEEAEATRQIALSQRRTEVSRARQETVEAESRQRTAERKAKRTRILTEKELRREQLRPYTEVAKAVGKGVYGAGRLVARGIQKLGEMGKARPTTRSQGLDIGKIDLGFPKPGEKKEKPIDLDIKIE